MITKATRKFLEKIGSIGGARGTGDSKRRTSEQARKAAKARWRKERQKKNVA